MNKFCLDRSTVEAIAMACAEKVETLKPGHGLQAAPDSRLPADRKGVYASQPDAGTLENETMHIDVAKMSVKIQFETIRFPSHRTGSIRSLW